MNLLPTDRLSPVELATRLGVSNQTVLRWIKLGQLQAYRVGGRYWISESAVNSMIEKLN